MSRTSEIQEYITDMLYVAHYKRFGRFDTFICSVKAVRISDIRIATFS